MIRKNSIDCKLIQLKRKNHSGFKIFDRSMEAVCIESEVCPTCGLIGGCSPHASYLRYLIDFEEGRPVCHQIEITRVICSCGATHAILPDPIIPYNQYSLFYILIVLALYFNHLMSIEQICNIYMITPNTLYRWADTYSSHRSEWQGLLKSTSADVKRSLLDISHQDPYSTFAVFFIQTTTLSFLQTHANPANCKLNLQFTSFSGASHTT